MTGKHPRKVAAVVGTMGFLLLAVGSRAQAQIAYVPGIGFIPSGQTMTVTPAVSADRRYVRLGVNPFFNALNGFQTINIPAAVGGGNFGGALAGMNGVIAQAGDDTGVMGFDDYGDVIGGPAPGRPPRRANQNALVPAGGEPPAGVPFGPPEGLIKGDPFSLDAIDQNRNKAMPAFPVAAGDQPAAAGFQEDAFVEEGGPMVRSRARAVRSNRAKNSKARSTPQRSRTPNRAKAKKVPKNKSQSTGVDSK